MSIYFSFIERSDRARKIQPMLLVRAAGERVATAFGAAMQHLLRAMLESNRHKAEQMLKRYDGLIEPDQRPGSAPRR